MSTNKTLILLGGKKDNSYSYGSGIGKTESISCNVAVRDTKPLKNLRAAVLNNQLYICGGRFDTYRSDGTTECFKNELGNSSEYDGSKIFSHHDVCWFIILAWLQGFQAYLSIDIDLLVLF